MSRRNALPSSLELLLDTMCNTFGGIVFIAIALVIITQVAQKVLTETAKLRGTPEAKQLLREQNIQLEQEISELMAELKEEALRMARCSAEKRAKIEELLQARLDLATSQQKIDALAEQFAQLQEQKSAVGEELQELQDQVAAAEANYQKMQEERQLNLDAMAALRQQVEKLQKENRGLEQAAQEGQDVFTITFSMETASANLKQCVVLVRNGRVYLENVNLSWRELGGNDLEANFGGNGFAVDSNELAQALSRISRHSYQLDIWADRQSFDALVALRQLLRGKQYRVSWSYTSDFRFATGGSGRNSSF